jgi:hypothetical protein
LSIRAYQIFAAMSPEDSESLLREVAEKSPGSFTQAVYAAAAAFKSRPQFLAKQPFAKRASMVRRALARVSTNPVAEELLAIYFLECKNEVLVEWLDALGIEHEEGSLKEESPAEPPTAKLQEVVKDFRGDGGSFERELLLKAFAAQDAIDWPSLDELISS